MKTFYNNRFGGHYPVGTSAVVVALNKKQAAALLENSLKLIGLEQVCNEDDFIEINTHDANVVILQDGDY